LKRGSISPESVEEKTDDLDKKVTDLRVREGRSKFGWGNGISDGRGRGKKFDWGAGGRSVFGLTESLRLRRTRSEQWGDKILMLASLFSRKA